MDKRKKTKGQTMIYKQKDKQYNGQKKKDQGTNNDLQTEGQTIQWTKKKTKGQTMIYNQKDKQYNGKKKKDQGTNNDLQTEGQTIQWTKEKRPRDKQ